MAEVRYSVNGKYFKDFGTFISESDGLFGALKRKSVNSYDWAEYHGSSPDLSNPRFEPREITLKGFVVGDNWEIMKSNFDEIVSEFSKPGTQRLLIEPLGLKALPYEVYMPDEVKLDKTFKDRKMIGTFTLKLIEPNPIKKVLYFTGSTLNLAYNSPNQTEIFYGNGLKEMAKGNVSLSNKTLANRFVSEYAFEGRNLALNSKTFLDQNSDWVRNFVLSEKLIIGQKYTVRIRLKAIQNPTDYFQINDVNGNNTFALTKINPLEFGLTFTANSDSSELVLVRQPQGSGFWYQFESFKIEKGNKATPYSVAPEDEKYIIIAGNVEEITNLTTNADVLWEQL